MSIAVEQPGGPVTADIVEGPQSSVAATDDKDRAADKVQALEIPFVGQVALMANHLPRRQQNLVDFPLIEPSVPIDPVGQSEPDIVIHSHGALPVMPGDIAMRQGRRADPDSDKQISISLTVDLFGEHHGLFVLRTDSVIDTIRQVGA